MRPATGFFPRRNLTSSAKLHLAKPGPCRPARRVALHCQAVATSDRPGTAQAGKVRAWAFKSHYH